MSIRSTTTGTDVTLSRPVEGCPGGSVGGQQLSGHLPPARLVGYHHDQPPPVDVMAGPHTIVALGEDCLVCEEGLEPGQVYVFCRDATGSGVAHESCADSTGPEYTDRALLQ